MFDIGFLELLVLAIIALVVIGPERLPSAARTAGRTVGKVRRFFSAMQQQLDQEIRLEELNKKIMDQTQGQTFANNNEGSNVDHPPGNPMGEPPKPEPAEQPSPFDTEAVSTLKEPDESGKS